MAGDFDEMRRFIGQDILLNTFIGGVGASYITSAASFASKTAGLLETDIQNFSIDAFNNVSMYITKPYSTILNTFNVTSVTYFIDLDGLIFGLAQSFVGATNLKYFYAPNADLEGAGNSIENVNKLLKINVKPIYLQNRFLLRNANKLKKLYFPNTTLIGNSNYQFPVLRDLASLERLYLKNLTSANSTFNDGGRTPTEAHDLTNIKTGCKIYIGDYCKVKDRQAFNWLRLPSGSIDVGDKFYINGLTYTCVSGTPTVDGEFQWSSFGGTTGINLGNAINADTRTGTYSTVRNVRFGSTLGLYVLAPGVGGNAVTLSKDPSNTGSGVTIGPANFYGGHDLHPIMIYARDTRGCTIIECGSVIFVDAPTLLSYSNLTSNSVDLNFTPPTPNANGTDAYEVWVDDGTLWRKLFEHSEITSSGDTVDLSDVISDVGSLTGVKIKIRTIDGQMNFSDFSNEITL